ncbi:winged helix-turn-helix transcriptional regulator [Frigoribacterium sp. CFBP 13729]|uniref:MarR family winged helix-turn-helix transcriptional regulator n=1 Tax=unclassified Frigoribacterium TaxID=2627005 RepID=UPI001784193D|nr:MULTISPECIES: MarR family winged helix-turn-helix transcriptional regulator [unclassified Frigoribacterium]MBD8583563.1 winged helix-turn-helix transcriptional regulator [Frigoribacterium sp. CFBP 8766]MBD8610341.1 winged helix-turn-helix transcriptional regulator [Frigoribacterium sp. CFBP 13729]
MSDLTPSISALLGQFSETITGLVTVAFDGTWADNEEFIVLSELALGDQPTTRELASSASMARHVLHHLIHRLRRDGLVSTAPSKFDGRAVAVELTPLGHLRAEALRGSLHVSFRESEHLAAAVLRGLDAPPRPQRRGGQPTDPLAVLGLTGRVGQELGASVRDLDLPDVTGRRRTTLVQIAATEDIRPRDVSEAQGTYRQSTAYVIDQLVAEGLVSRHRGRVPEDARAVTLMVTDRGRQVVDGIDDVVRHHRDTLVDLFSIVATWPSPRPSRA